MSGADRHNDGKTEMSYNAIGLESSAGMAKVWTAGAKKYSRGNWLKGFKYMSIVDSLERHMHAFVNGEDLDPETKLPHVDMIQCNAKMLSQFFHTRKDLDDRLPPAVNVARSFRSCIFSSEASDRCMPCDGSYSSWRSK